MSDTQQMDVIVIGTGGGAKLIRPLANMGYRVMAIDSGRLGGTCLNHGCIPSKMLIYPADVVREMQAAGSANVVGVPPDIRFTELSQRVSQTVDAESDQIEPIYRQHPNITLVRGHARFVAPRVIEVNQQRVTAPFIAIVTGSESVIPPIPGLESIPYITHKEALRLTTLPPRLVIIGGGYIALEMAHFFSASGSEVTVVTRGDILSGMDSDLRDRYRQLVSPHIQLIPNASIESVQANGDIQVNLNQPSGLKTVRGDQLLVATGMTPRIRDLGLDAGHIIHENGQIVVDQRLSTSVEGVVAFGDVIGPPYFRHKANYEGEYLFKHRFEKPSALPITYPPMPYALFGHPPIAGVGIMEQNATGSIIVGRAEIRSSAFGMAMNRQDGFVKLIFDAKTHALLGAHGVGIQTPSMMHMPIAFLKMNATLHDMLDTIYIHPALPEVIRNAVRNAASQI